jgi:hypothetical protein
LKIDYCSIENVFLSRNNNLRKGNAVYIEKDSCLVCEESYLTKKHKPSVYCSLSCSQKGENNSSYGGFPHNWKGGVRELNLPLYDTYSIKIEYAEEVRPFYDEEGRKLLEIKCSKCNNWFVPDIFQVNHRCRALNGEIGGEYRFYCSQECKDTCEVYKKRPEFYINIEKQVGKLLYAQEELSIWSQEVLSRANHICEICGGAAEQAHHIQPKKLEPFLALDPENGIALCKKCHNKHGHQGVCSTGKLSIRVCK